MTNHFMTTVFWQKHFQEQSFLRYSITCRPDTLCACTLCVLSPKYLMYYALTTRHIVPKTSVHFTLHTLVHFLCRSIPLYIMPCTSDALYHVDLMHYALYTWCIKPRKYDVLCLYTDALCSVYQMCYALEISCILPCILGYIMLCWLLWIMPSRSPS